MDISGKKTEGSKRQLSLEAKLGLTLVAIVATLCLAWTIGLMLLTVSPNATVNWVMNTKTFDDGTFWRFIDPPVDTLLLGLGGLSCIALGYLYIIARVTVFSKWQFTAWSTRHISFKTQMRSSRHSITKIAVANKAVSTSSNNIGPSETLRDTSSKTLRMIQVSKAKRKLVDLLLKLLDFVVQFILLTDMMGKGLPVEVIAPFTGMVVINILLSSLFIAAPHRQSGLVVVLLDTMFDILVSIGLPVLIVTYCMSTFSFDRHKFVIIKQVFPPGWFETNASINADPVQPQIIRTAFNSLRIHSVMTLFARVGSNFSLCHRFYQLAALIKNPVMRHHTIYPKNKVIAAVLVIFAVFTVVFVEESIRTSRTACRPHPECVENVWRWLQLRDNDLDQCPCLTMVDEEPRIKTFDEWMDPVDVTKKLSQLARSGDLQMISLLNRKLVSFPDELQRCTRLKHISLVYTHTITLPTWAKGFTELEYLHIEGKPGIATLIDLPDDIFDEMEMLTFLHLGAHMMTKIPRLSSLGNLKYLLIGFFLLLQELPSFDGLHSLERLSIPIIPLVDNVPDMSPLVNLKVFVTADRGMFCCNGFLGECDLTNSLCAAHLLWHLPPATCLSPNRTSKVATPATLAMFAKFPWSVCADQALTPATTNNLPSPETTSECGGVMYRQCTMPGGGEGMCYNTRLMAICCDPSSYPIEMRRREIAASAGEPCDPQYETWLGCK